MSDAIECSPKRPLPWGDVALTRLLGVRLIGDIHERAAEFHLRLPPGPKRRRRLARIAARRILFIHIPKNGGTSVSRALYGMQIGHATIRFYQAAARHLARSLPSFAILRDPEERFLSGYRHARAGGATDSYIHPAFHDHYRRFRSVDDVLDYLQEASSIYRIDHIFRPQSWYLTDATGAIAVDHLLMIDQLARIGTYLPGIRNGVPHLNRSRPLSATLTANQRERIRAIYADDFALIQAVPAPAGPRDLPTRTVPALAG